MRQLPVDVDNRAGNARVPSEEPATAPRIAAAYLLTYAGVGAIASFLPLYLQDQKGLSVSQIGLFGILLPSIRTVII